MNRHFSRSLGVIMASVLGLSTLTGCAGFNYDNFQSTLNDVIKAYQEGYEYAQNLDANTQEAGDTIVFEDTADEAVAPEEVVILYTNDVHTYINNTKKDDDDNVTRLLSYASIAAYKNELEAEGKNVILVDAGDHSQGTAFGGMDEGKSIIQIMNKTGYQLATLGNHEFDYGIMRSFGIMDEADFPYVSCNFISLEGDGEVLPAYYVFDIGNVKIAFVGISTPETITKSTPTYFQDANGEFIYDFKAADDGKELYEAVQLAVDQAREEADYVIGLGHLGVDPSSEPYRSTDVISNITGLDAFIDGHSHTTMENELVKDAAGNDVLLTQTGSYLGAIGEMTISPDGDFATKLITEYDGIDEDVDAVQQAWIDEVNNRLGEQIGVLDNKLYIMNPDNAEQRLIRCSDMNSGELAADAFYYYFNEVLGDECDMALVNGGGIRSEVEAGDLTYLSVKSVMPFGNVACMVSTEGQNILNALELGARMIGVISPDTGLPAEVGGFLHTAGLKYDIDSSIESTIEIDENGIFVGEPTGEYKVSNVQVYNRATGEYEPLELDKKYNVAGFNYHLRNSGDGLTMLSNSECVVDYVDEDYLVYADFIKAFAKNADGVAEVNNANSPLASYAGYIYDYENPLGSGRINIK